MTLSSATGHTPIDAQEMEIDSREGQPWVVRMPEAWEVGARGPETVQWAQPPTEASFQPQAQTDTADSHIIHSISEFCEGLLDAIRSCRILILASDEASERSTQLPQYLCRAGFADRGIIGFIEPDPTAGNFLARAIAQDGGYDLGRQVICQAHASLKSSQPPLLHFMTEDEFKAQLLTDPLMQRYSVLILGDANYQNSTRDESIHNAIIFISNQRPEVRTIIITSSLETEQLAGRFNGCPIFNIPSRI